jgi:molybdopterin/thiamine biosynthesis adenylyltransferase
MNSDSRFTFLPDQAYLDRAAKSGRSVAQEVAEAIENGEMPRRYQRNAQTLKPRDQASLARARVLLVGCGGLGGHVLEFLARAGVGTILACDPDRIELHNANRQLLATTGALGRPKVQAACERAVEANPLVAVEPFAEGFHAGMFQGVGIAVDCLGGAAHRKDLQNMAATANTPLVSAGVSGWTALISTTWPGETGLGEFMSGRENGSELAQGIPSPVVGFAASLQAAEVIRILAGAPSALRGSLLVADLAEMRFSTVSLQTGFDGIA